MAFNKEHDRDHFYKYTTVSTAKLILKNTTLRWSNPRLFNDPFDMQTGFHWDFNIKDLSSLMLSRLEEIALSNAPAVFVEEVNYSEVVKALKVAIKKVGFQRENFQNLFGPVYQGFANYMESERIRYKAMRDDYLKKDEGFVPFRKSRQYSDVGTLF